MSGTYKFKLSQLLTALALTTVLASSPAFAQRALKLSTLTKAGIKPSACPKYWGTFSTGLFAKLLPRHWVCLGSVNLKGYRTVAKSVATKPLLSPSRYNYGTQFTPVFNQEGDVQTEPFEIGNFPVKIYWQVTNSSFKAKVQITVVDAATGKIRYEKISVRGEDDSHFAFNYPGMYYVRINGYGVAPRGEDGEEIQPVFSVRMETMEPYFSDALTKADVKDAEIKTSPCPRQLLDLDSGKVFKLSAAHVCSKRDTLEDAFFTEAPLNLTHNVFMATEISESDEGAYISYPFRITKPTQLEYSIDDPTGGKGTTNIYMYDLSTRKKVYTIVNGVRGSISGSTTYMNIPGDYYFVIDTNASNPEENGDIGWSIDVDTADY